MFIHFARKRQCFSIYVSLWLKGDCFYLVSLRYLTQIIAWFFMLLLLIFKTLSLLIMPAFSTHHFLLAVPLTKAVRPGGFNTVCPSVSSCSGILLFWPKLPGTGFIFQPLLFSTYPVRSFEHCWTETTKLAVWLCVPLVGMWTYVHSA